MERKDAGCHFANVIDQKAGENGIERKRYEHGIVESIVESIVASSKEKFSPLPFSLYFSLLFFFFSFCVSDPKIILARKTVTAETLTGQSRGGSRCDKKEKKKKEKEKRRR